MTPENNLEIENYCQSFQNFEKNFALLFFRESFLKFWFRWLELHKKMLIFFLNEQVGKEKDEKQLQNESVLFLTKRKALLSVCLQNLKKEEIETTEINAAIGEILKKHDKVYLSSLRKISCKLSTDLLQFQKQKKVTSAYKQTYLLPGG